MIVIGPVQTGKTTGFAIPAILEWQGPVVATSVKTDLLRDTLAARAAIPDAQRLGLRPDREHRHADRRLDAACRLRDLAGRATRRLLARRRRAPRRRGIENARVLVRGRREAARAAALRGRVHADGTMADVVRWIDTQEEERGQLGRSS